MLLTTLAGLGAGLVHALAGPDHVLSLTPLALGSRARAWRIGLVWGLGHGAGTLCWAVALFASVSATRIEGLERWSDVAAGAALIAMGVMGLRRRLVPPKPGSESRGIFWVGLIHGLTGGGALLLFLLAVVSRSAWDSGNYLLGFVLGSVVAMSAFTALVARLSSTAGESSKLVVRVSWGASIGSMALGAFWIAQGLSRL